MYKSFHPSTPLRNLVRPAPRTWKQTDVDKAEAELRSLPRHLEPRHPGATARLREGLEETFTVTRLGLPALDTLLHHRTLVQIEGESYRIPAHLTRVETLRKALSS